MIHPSAEVIVGIASDLHALAMLVRLKGQIVSLMDHKEFCAFSQPRLIHSQSAILGLCSPFQGGSNQPKAQHNVLIPRKCSMDELHSLSKVQTCTNSTQSEHLLSEDSLGIDQPRTITTCI